MATTEYGVNYTNANVTVPAVKIPVGEQAATVKWAFDTFTSTGVITVNSVLKMMKIPKGCRVLDVVVSSTDLGTTGILDIGWAANGVDAADADGFLASVDVKSAANTVSMVEQADMPGLFKEFGAETQIQIAFQEATTAAGTIKLGVMYADY